MEASAKVLEPELLDPFEREIDEALPEGEDHASAMLRVDYLLQRIREESARLVDLAEFTARRIAMIQDHGTGQLAQIRRRIVWLESRVRMHVPASGEGMEREYGKRSMSLPHGTIGYRSRPAAVRIMDHKAATAWAVETGVAHMKPNVLAADVNKHFEATGEVPPGCEYLEAEDRFYVTPAKPEGH